MEKVNVSRSSLMEATGVCFQISEALHALNDIVFINGLPELRDTAETAALCQFVLHQCSNMAEVLANKLDDASVGKGSMCQELKEDQAAE